MVIDAIGGVVLGRALSWLVANAIRPTLGALAPIVGLLLYFLAVIAIGTAIGCLDASDPAHVFAIAFAAGFVISPTLLRQGMRALGERRFVANLTGLIFLAAILLVAILTGFWIAHLSLVYP